MATLPQLSAVPLVSVIIPAYNAAPTLQETLYSVANQTVRDLEVIVVDDGSTDATRDLVESFARNDSRIRYVWQQNARLGAARNRGVAEARGTYISAIDADDLWAPSKLARQLDVMAEAGDVIVLTGLRRFADEAGTRQWLQETLPPPIRGGGRDLDRLLTLRSNQMAIFTTALFRRDQLQELKGWNTAIWTAEDWELWLRAAKVFRFVNINECLYFYRKHPMSNTRRQNLRRVLTAHVALIQQQTADEIGQGVVEAAIAGKYIATVEALRDQGEIGAALSCWMQAGIATPAWRSRRYWAELLDIGQKVVRR